MQREKVPSGTDGLTRLVFLAEIFVGHITRPIAAINDWLLP